MKRLWNHLQCFPGFGGVQCEVTLGGVNVPEVSRSDGKLPMSIHRGFHWPVIGLVNNVLIKPFLMFIHDFCRRQNCDPMWKLVEMHFFLKKSTRFKSTLS